MEKAHRYLHCKHAPLTKNTQHFGPPVMLRDHFHTHTPHHTHHHVMTPGTSSHIHHTPMPTASPTQQSVQRTWHTLQAPRRCLAVLHMQAVLHAMHPLTKLTDTHNNTQPIHCCSVRMKTTASKVNHVAILSHTARCCKWGQGRKTTPSLHSYYDCRTTITHTNAPCSKL